MWPHAMTHSQTHGNSPGNGITPKRITREPLATEGEATPGPDDYNPYEDYDPRATVESRSKRDPTRDPDPFVFDDIGMSLGRELEDTDPFGFF